MVDKTVQMNIDHFFMELDKISLVLGKCMLRHMADLVRLLGDTVCVYS